jgi:hypothetical protein
VTVAFDGCFRALDALRGATAPDSKSLNEMHANLVSAARDLYHRATEFIENIDDGVSKCLSSDPKRLTKFSGASTLRKKIAIPCNKLKHNHNRMHYVQATALGLVVPGFTIYHLKGGALQPNCCYPALECQYLLYDRRRAFLIQRGASSNICYAIPLYV